MPFSAWRKAARKGRPLFLLGLCLLIAVLCASCARGGEGQKEGGENVQEEEFFAMDTKMTLRAYGMGAQPTLAAAKERLLAFDALWSAEREGSDVYRLNHAGGGWVALAPETMRLLALSKEMGEQTGGALDVTLYPVLRLWGFAGGEAHRVPEEAELRAALAQTGTARLTLEDGRARLDGGAMLDLGATAKGYAGHVVAEEMREAGVTSALLDLGGNIEAVGKRPDGAPWRVGLRNPFGGALIGVLAAADEAVVTSAIDQRYFTDDSGRKYWHLLDPATGKPAESGLASAAVIMADGGKADALSTALFVMGKERATALWRERRDFEMVLVAMDGEVSITEGLVGRFEAGEGCKGEAEVIR